MRTIASLEQHLNLLEEILGMDPACHEPIWLAQVSEFLVYLHMDLSRYGESREQEERSAGVSEIFILDRHFDRVRRVDEIIRQVSALGDEVQYVLRAFLRGREMQRQALGEEIGGLPDIQETGGKVHRILDSLREFTREERDLVLAHEVA